MKSYMAVEATISRGVAKLISACLLASLLTMAASGEDFVEGVHYERLAIPVEPRDDGLVDVVEVFSYGCIHCFNFDPAMEAWRAVEREGVAFRRLPAVFGKSWEPVARWFYTADVLGVGEQIHRPMFTAIHDHGLDMRDPELVAKLFENVAGVERTEFDKAAESFSVSYRIQQDMSSVRKFRVNAVPTMVVGGQFRIDGEMAGSNDRMLEVVDFLVAKIQDEASASAQ